MWSNLRLREDMLIKGTVTTIGEKSRAVILLNRPAIRINQGWIDHSTGNIKGKRYPCIAQPLHRGTCETALRKVKPVIFFGCEKGAQNQGNN